ncbi:MAG: hypothetical protein IKP96_00560 [Elusimicrobiaceae bacterium]|nr:hypothetical protein [Elusimicrobiaceae bacterium]
MSYPKILSKVRERRAQILLPSVLLAPIFILVVYLLFEIAKVSTIKVRQQLALDNAAYSQISATSTYLNALALVNGPLAYRVIQSTSDGVPLLQPKASRSNLPKISVFELFYQGGGVPTIGPDYDTGINKPPSAESTDWGLKYYSGENLDQNASRADWEKESPKVPDGNTKIPVMSKKLVDDYHFPAKEMGVPAIVNYLETYARLGSIYKSQDYVYEQVSKNAIMFREAYYLNVTDCKRADCARQSAAQLRQFLDIQTKPFELSQLVFYASDSAERYHHGAYQIPFKAEELLNGEKLFQFAYMEPASRGKLKTLSRGVLLKQPFKLPRNHFNINLEQKYKPYVRTRVTLACPRAGNNCVWPNPLPKYNVTLEP